MLDGTTLGRFRYMYCLSPRVVPILYPKANVDSLYINNNKQQGNAARFNGSFILRFNGSFILIK